MQQMAEQLLTVGRIHTVIKIQDFIKLPGEEVKDSSKDFIEHIAELYAGPDCNAETDKEAVKQPQIKLNKVLMALQKLCLYEERQEDYNRDIITTLLRHERQLQNQQSQNTKQQSIAMYFSIADHSVATSYV